MEDDFLEDEDRLFDKDEAFDYAMLDEMEKERGQRGSGGCLPSLVLIFMISVFSIVLLINT